MCTYKCAFRICHSNAWHCMRIYLIIPNAKPALAPTRPHPWHWPEALKGRCLGWEWEGGRAGGGGHHASLSVKNFYKDRHVTCLRFFCHFFGVKQGEMLPIFLSEFFAPVRSWKLKQFGRRYFWGRILGWIASIKAGEMLPFFSEFFAPVWCWKFKHFGFAFFTFTLHGNRYGTSALQNHFGRKPYSCLILRCCPVLSRVSLRYELNPLGWVVKPRWQTRCGSFGECGETPMANTVWILWGGWWNPAGKHGMEPSGWAVKPHDKHWLDGSCALCGCFGCLYVFILGLSTSHLGEASPMQTVSEATYVVFHLCCICLCSLFFCRRSVYSTAGSFG